jgi:hypothetical protein
MPYRCGATLGTLANADTVFGFLPEATYSPGGDRATMMDAKQPFRGFPRATWSFGYLTFAEWANAKAVLAASGFTADCYIETTDDEGNFDLYQAVINFPDPAQLERFLTKYLYVKIEFVLVSGLGGT